VEAAAAEVVSAPAPQPEVVVDVVEEEEPQDADVSLDEQLQLAGELTSTESALMALLDIWGVDYQRGQRGCTQATNAGYECLFQRGSWSGLKQFDRPAILTLIDRRGAAHNVVLTAVSGATVELSIGGVAVNHALSDVSEMWFGEYLLLWQPPNGVSESLGPGSTGAGVTWLRQSLAAIDERYSTIEPESGVYDNDLADKVREFQRDNRLDVDGLAGHQTQIIINSLLQPDDTPRLTIPRLAQE
jgi:general secretion pathway protein A